MLHVGINGFGRIGRLAFRCLLQTDGVEVVGVNDVAPLDNLAYLLRHDSVYRGPGVAVEANDHELRWGERAIPYSQEKEPSAIDWDGLGADVVVEASGQFTERDKAAGHLEAGASHVIITAPADGVDLTICLGVNEDQFDPEQHKVVSNASCTTNCVAPVAKVLDERFGIETGFLTTVHAVTSSQKLVDSPSKKWIRGRSALVSIIPTSTGAAKAAELVLPQLKGKLDGLAMRVPIADGSIVDLVCHVREETDREAVNRAFREAADTDRLRGILGISDELLVSSDIVGSEYSALVAADSTRVLGGRMLKVLAWYDNEWGYSRRIADLAAFIGERLPASARR